MPETLHLFFVCHGANRRIAQALTGQAQKQSDVAPAHALNADHGRHIGPIADTGFLATGLGGMTGANGIVFLTIIHAIQHGGHQIQFLGVGMLGQIILA